jgi:predicted PolB exonuclease-like 3'-5' exonuclease
MIYIIDIETKPDERLAELYCESIKPPANYKDLDKIEDWKLKKLLEARKVMAVSPDYCEVLCVGVKGNDDTMILSLDEFGRWLEDAGQVHFVSFNGKHFDFPALIKAGIRAGVKMPYRWLNDCCKRWNSRDHTDLAECLAYNGQFLSLDTYAKIYLGKSKEPINFDLASNEEIIQHCKEDLDITEQLFNKFSWLV